MTSAIAHHGSDPMGEQNDGFAARSGNFCIEFPILAPTCQVLNGITIFHEGGGLMRETLSVNAHKYMETT